ncbi:MAG: sigma-54-dependent transcriptional regulator [Fimbriimonadaceae bacterium]
MSDKKRILIVDDEANLRRILQVAFEKTGYQAFVAEDVNAALKFLADNSVDCILTDVTMPGRTGYELMQEVKAKDPDLPVVIMTAYGTIPQAVQAIRDGAFEYITKPFDLAPLKKVIASAVESRASGVPAGTASPQKVPFVSESAAMKEVANTVVQVADSKATVLITGESGAGKEVVAKALHTCSLRAAKPFVAVSCAALPETLLEAELFGYEKGAFTGAAGAKQGRFEMANGGTLFLDEIGEIPLSVQVKLLRVLQEREFERLGSTNPIRIDVRLISATNRDLHQAVNEGTFRLDLLYRLQVVEIHVPPLRERREDILPLARLFIERSARENQRTAPTMSPEVEASLQSYAWPGNVRELQNAVERAMALLPATGEVIEPGLLPPAIKAA